MSDYLKVFTDKKRWTDVHQVEKADYNDKIMINNNEYDNLNNIKQLEKFLYELGVSVYPVEDNRTNNE